MKDTLAVDDALIRRLAELLDETGLSEIEVSQGTQHVRVARTAAGALEAIPLRAESAPAAADADAGGPERRIDSTHPDAVTAPMVGTIFVAPEPGAQPFINQGSSVQKGDILFVIEAMKTMNPVRAPRAGTVSRIMVENETPVEFGEVLVLLT